jgi:hypothetical protein
LSFWFQNASECLLAEFRDFLQVTTISSILY